ncbi:MAG: DNA-binding protein [Candidatus Omnitrophota bacterium]|nr:DNA-binding protein [Candidatus Omnitrophota bacterium]MBU1929002.1 DNA-binding protein [Candidatus Omnitrophota bacterium]MBU2035683.1 DNA-binding protein [Candidatus Omnitrophota bacterium]MBU2221065.1 DNA-binding protein [Candidatus Omnitrophota bacterium]MBU2258847.1 DNA-binding protein [Candidatus Omnitrophota bacterium]
MFKSKIENRKFNRYLRAPGFGGRFKVFCSAFLILIFALSIAYAETVSSADLINNTKEFDTKTITYEGEVIGDIMIRGRNVWVNLNDGKNAIGVWLGKALAGDIAQSGNYKFKGDWFQVTGVFNRACLEHGGGLDIHAQTISKIKSGYAVDEGLNWRKINLAVILFFILLTLWILRQLKNK